MRVTDQQQTIIIRIRVDCWDRIRPARLPTVHVGRQVPLALEINACSCH